MRRMIALALVMGLLLTGCGGTSEDLTAGYIPRRVEAVALTDSDTPFAFAAALFRNSAVEGENTLVSPLSVLSALTMSANGAEGETLTQMEQTLGATRQALNSWLHSYMSARKEDDALHLANAIWFNRHERFQVDHDFLQTNADYFGAAIRTADFDDATCREINAWIKENTGGMIDGILDQIPEEALMYLVNALAFEARWLTEYQDGQVSDGFFTTEDGRKQHVELMYDTVQSYLQLPEAAGFLRYYAGSRYAFAALLPNEGTTVGQLVQILDAETLAAVLASPRNIPVRTAIPKFEAESTLDMNQILMDMGMTHAFDPMLADFGGLGSSASGNIYISRVIHKTIISVGEQGTRAGAATVVENSDRAMGVTEDEKTVLLDRPFVYMIIDCGTGLPIFMGTCMDLG